MATYLENLTTARDQIAANLVEITANPKPSYDIDGQSVDWTDYFRALTEQLAAMNTLVNGGEPFEEMSQGYT